MKLFLLLSLFLTLSIPGVRAAEWELVWSDEFDYRGLPDPTKWDDEDGFVRNHEAQFHTRARPENAPRVDAASPGADNPYDSVRVFRKKGGCGMRTNPLLPFSVSLRVFAPSR